MKRRLRALLMFSALKACVLAGCAESPSEISGSLRQLILLGSATEGWAGTVAIQGPHGAQCSGALVGSNLVITARHCVTGESVLEPDCANEMFTVQQAEQNETRVAFSADLDDPTPWFNAARVELAPGGLVCGSDLAVVVLAPDDVPDWALPIGLNLVRPVMAGDRYTAMGFGVDNATGRPAGELRLRHDLRVLCEPELCGREAGPGEFSGEGAVCAGDSGGPALDAQGHLIGVAVRGAPDCESSVYAASFSARDWLLEVANLASEQPPWVSRGTSTAPIEAPPEANGLTTGGPETGCSFVGAFGPHGGVGPGWLVAMCLGTVLIRRASRESFK